MLDAEAPSSNFGRARYFWVTTTWPTDVSDTDSSGLESFAQV
jgi:hypothetical protein